MFIISLLLYLWHLSTNTTTGLIRIIKSSGVKYCDLVLFHFMCITLTGWKEAVIVLAFRTLKHMLTQVFTTQLVP